MTDEKLNGEIIESQLISQNELMLNRQGNLTEISLYQLEELAKEAPKRAEAINNIMKASIAVTTQRDWVDFQGNPYCRNDGAIRVAELWGVKIINVRFLPIERGEDKNGRYEIYTYIGDAIWGNVIMPVQGAASTKDKFLAAKVGSKGLKPFDEVNTINIKQKALSNMKGNAGRQLFGLNSRTWDDLKEHGITRDKSAKVDFKKGDVKSNSKPNKPTKKRDVITKFWVNMKELGLDGYKDQIRMLALDIIKIRMSEATDEQIEEYRQWIGEQSKDRDVLIMKLNIKKPKDKELF